MSEIDELVFKVSVELDDQDLAKARRELQAIHREAKEASKQLGIADNAAARESILKSAASGAKAQAGKDRDVASAASLQNKDAVSILARSERHLASMVDLLRRSTRSGRSNFGGSPPNLPPPGGGGGDGRGRDRGMNPKDGTQGFSKNSAAIVTGNAILEIIKSVVSLITSFKDKAVELLTDKFTRELDLHKLSEQTGYSVDSLYKMEKAAGLAGTSLKSLVDNAHSLQEEFMFGMDEKKAQALLAMGINPVELMNEAGNDPMKMQELLFAKASEVTEGMPASMRAMMIQKVTGLSPDQQYGMRHKNDANVQGAAAALSAERGPMLPAEEWRDNFVLFNATLQRLQAVTDKALDQNMKGVQSIIASFVEVQAGIVNIISNATRGAQDGPVTAKEYAERTDALSLIYANKENNGGKVQDQTTQTNLSPNNWDPSSWRTYQPSQSNQVAPQNNPPKRDPYADIEAAYKREKNPRMPVEQWNQKYPGSPPPPFGDLDNRSTLKTAGR